MAKKLNSMPDYIARLPKHPHDVSQSTCFTTCPGMLSPVYFDMLHAGDDIHFSASEFVRFNPLEQQPLGDVDVHLDYFFVPLTVMYTPSSSLFYQTDDLVSSVFDSNLQLDTFPLYDFHKFLSEFNNVCSLRSPFATGDVVSSGNTYLPVNHFDCFGKSVFRIWDFFDMSPDVLMDVVNGSFLSENYPLYTPWFALAYQAIYQLYFRNDDREPKNYHYNVDKYYNGDLIQEDYSITSNYVKSIFNINYASRPKDYFNAVKVSPIASSVSLLSGTTLASLYNDVNSWLNTSTFVPANTNRLGQNLGPSSTQVISSTSTISTQNVRQLFMVEKFLRVVGRAEKNYESQFLAHYGIKIPHDVMHNITHIGHDMITIKPEAVISQANTYNAVDNTGSALGEIGGKGSGMLSGRKHNFHAPFHGVFMCISHIVPRRRYVVGLSKLHQLYKPNMFWQAEFDQKGMQPLFNFEVSLNSVNDSMTSSKGWQFGFEQFKRKYDRVSRAFMPVRDATSSVNSYAPWVIASYPYGLLNNDGQCFYPADESVSSAYWLLVSPNDLNVNMQVPHSTLWSESFFDSPWIIYQTDPFICDFNMYCKKVNGMSEYSEPEL